MHRVKISSRRIYRWLGKWINMKCVWLIELCQCTTKLSLPHIISKSGISGLDIAQQHSNWQTRELYVLYEEWGWRVKTKSNMTFFILSLRSMHRKITMCYRKHTIYNFYKKKPICNKNEKSVKCWGFFSRQWKEQKVKTEKKILGLVWQQNWLKCQYCTRLKQLHNSRWGAESSFPAINRGSVVQSVDWSAVVRGSSVIDHVTRDTPPSIVYVPQFPVFVKRRTIIMCRTVTEAEALCSGKPETTAQRLHTELR